MHRGEARSLWQDMGEIGKSAEITGTERDIICSEENSEEIISRDRER